MSFRQKYSSEIIFIHIVYEKNVFLVIWLNLFSAFQLQKSKNNYLVIRIEWNTFRFMF